MAWTEAKCDKCSHYLVNHEDNGGCMGKCPCDRKRPPRQGERVVTHVAYERLVELVRKFDAAVRSIELTEKHDTRSKI